MKGNTPIKSNRSWRIPIEAIIELKAQNLPNSEIARRLGCNPSNITERTKNLETTKQYIKSRAMILAHYQRKGIEYITSTKLHKANLFQITNMIKEFHTMERLETDQSTQNIAYADALKAQKQIKVNINTLIEVRQQRQDEISQLPIDAGLLVGDKAQLDDSLTIEYK